ncbi:MAG: oligosaccharide flippase family protein [Candidatus Coproplasma sp.]
MKVITLSNERKLGVVLQYAQMGLSIVIQLIYTPIMLRILGDSEYGIYSLASSIIAYLNLLSLGFGASYIRFYSKYKQAGDEEGVKQLNGLYMLVFSVIGIISLTAGLIIAFNVGIFFNDTYTANDLHIAKILMIFLSINLAISFPASVFVSYITSQEKFIFQKLVNMGKTVLSPCLCIAVLFLGYGSIGMVIVTTAVSLIIDFFNVGYCFGKLKMRFSFRKPNWVLLKEIAFFSVFIAINQIIDQINWQTDKIILGKMINASAVAIYAVAANINTMYLNFSTAISSVFTPRIHNIVNDQEKTESQKNKELTDLFVKVGRVQFLVLGLILTGFIFFGQFFISKWAGENYGDSYYVVLLLISPVTIPLCQNIGIEIQRAKNKHQFRSIVYLVMALLNVGISILFTFWWGYFGTALGTTISLLLANGLIMNVYYQMKLGINIIEFWKQILRMCLGLIIPVTFGVVLLMFIHYTEIWQFLLLIMAYCIIYAVSVWFLSMNRNEKDLIIKPIKRVIKRNDKVNKQN